MNPLNLFLQQGRAICISGLIGTQDNYQLQECASYLGNVGKNTTMSLEQNY